MNLYEVNDSIKQIQDMIEDGVPLESLQDTLEALQEEFHLKVENMSKLIRNLDADIDALKNEESRLKDKRLPLEKRVDGIKQYLFNQLEVAGKEKVKLPNFTISIRNNKPSVEVLDGHLVPTQYIVLSEPKIDKLALYKDLKEGLEIPGVTLKPSRSLQIR
jgi:phage host-nuclease inhibitor protein Gam